MDLTREQFEMVCGKYIEFRIYECPTKPDEKGKYIGKTPLLEQAQAMVTSASSRDKQYFIKGVRADGVEVLLL